MAGGGDFRGRLRVVFVGFRFIVAARRDGQHAERKQKCKGTFLGIHGVIPFCRLSLYPKEARKTIFHTLPWTA